MFKFAVGIITALVFFGYAKQLRAKTIIAARKKMSELEKVMEE